MFFLFCFSFIFFFCFLLLFYLLLGKLWDFLVFVMGVWVFGSLVWGVCVVLVVSGVWWVMWLWFVVVLIWDVMVW